MIYTFTCKECEHDFEVTIPLSEFDKQKCPKCDGKVERKFISTPIVWKCDGAYNTEVRNSKYL